MMKKLYYDDDNNGDFDENFGLQVTNIVLVDGYSDGYRQDFQVSGSTSGPSGMTNVKFIFPVDKGWDLNVLDAARVAPTAMSVSNLFALSYFDIVRGGTDAAVEVITNIQFQYTGSMPYDVGEFILYRDTNLDGILTTADIPVSTITMDGSLEATNSFSTLSEDLISEDVKNPTRYWLGARITNDADAVYAQSFSAVFSTFQAKALRLSNISLVEELTPAVTRIDRFYLSAGGAIETGGPFKQGEPDIGYFWLSLSNQDPDAVYHLTSLHVTNVGSAQPDDFNTIILYKDDGDESFDSAGEYSPTVGQWNGSAISFTFNPPLTVSNTNTMLWFSFSMKYSSVVGREAAFQVSDVSNMIEFDPIGTRYDANSNMLPVLWTPVSLPVSPSNGVIIPHSAQGWDFRLLDVDYLDYPISYRENQFVPVASLMLVTDYDQTNIQSVSGVSVLISSTNIGTNVGGLIYLYRETNGIVGVQPGDELLGSNTISGTNLYTIITTSSNYSIEENNPDTLHLAFQMTNSIVSAMADTLSFRITNLIVTGPNNGVVTNTAILSSTSSEARIDSGQMDVFFISNYITPTFARQSSIDNSFLQIGIRGNDPDGVVYLDQLAVVTNGVVNSLEFDKAHIQNIKVYDSNNQLLTIQSMTNGYVDLPLPIPYPVDRTGTVLTIRYDIAATKNVVAKKFGLTLPSNFAGLVDNINDGFEQKTNISYPVAGQWPGFTNVTIVSFEKNPWDFMITGVSNVAPVQIGLHDLYSMSYFDVRTDREAQEDQWLTNVTLQIVSSENNISGWVYLYRDSSDELELSPGTDFRIASNWFTNGNEPINLSCAVSNLNDDESTPKFTRIWTALEITNGAPEMYSRRIFIKPVDLKGKGPDGGKFTNELGTNVGNYFDTNFNTNVRSSIFLKDIAFQVVQAVTNAVRGEENNLAFRLSIIKHATNSIMQLQQLVITNHGNADVSDLGPFKLVRDINTNNVFEPEIDVDTVIINYNLSDQKYILNALTPVNLDKLTNVYFGVFKVNVGADISHKTAFQIQSASFNDTIDEPLNNDYTILPEITNTEPWPGTVVTNSINPYEAKPYDFYLTAIDYQNVPSAVTTNREREIAHLSLYSDVDYQVMYFRGLDLQMQVPLSNSNCYGLLSLYRETNHDGQFSSAGDELLQVTNWIGGTSTLTFWIDNLTNVSMNSLTPDDFYLTFSVTNTIDLADNSFFSFQITNLRCATNDSANAGLFTNLIHLTNVPDVSRVDDYRVQLVYLSNYFTNRYPRQGEFDVPVLNFALVNRDSDAAVTLKQINLVTNDLTTASPSDVSLIKVYQDTGNRRFSALDDIPRGYGSLTETGADILLAPYAELSGSSTNTNLFFVVFDVSYSATTGVKLGLSIPEDGIIFHDNSADGYSNQAQIEGALPGPVVPGTVTVTPFASQPWDFQVTRKVFPALEAAKPSHGSETNIFPLVYTELISDGQIPDFEKLTNICYVLSGPTAGIAGRTHFYLEETVSVLNNPPFEPGTYIPLGSQDFLSVPVTNDFMISGGVSNLSLNLSTPARLWLCLEITNTNTGVYSNVINGNLLALGASGPDDGVVDATNLLSSTNTGTTRIDKYLIDYYTDTNFPGISPVNVEQGFGPVFSLNLILSNLDVDAVYHLQKIMLTNLGTADLATAISDIKLYYDDDNNGDFDVSDQILLSAVPTSNLISLVNSPPQEFTGRTAYNFWVTYAVRINAAVSETIQLAPVNGTNGICFVDNIADTAELSAQVISKLPAGYSGYKSSTIVTPGTNIWDIKITSVDYETVAPFAVTTNDRFPVAAFRFKSDYTESGPYSFDGLDIEIDSSVDPLTPAGRAYLYRETGTLSSGFSAADDALFTNIDFQDGVINLRMTNFTNIPSGKETLCYVIVSLTNDISLVSDHNLSFTITNFRCAGTNNGVVDNEHEFTNAPAQWIKMDDHAVEVVFITNFITDYTPDQNSKRNPMLHIRLSNRDSDTTNWLVSLQVLTNTLSSNYNGEFPLLAIYTNYALPPIGLNGAKGELATFGDGYGKIQIDPSEPLAINGSLPLDFYISCDIKDADDIVGKRAGLFVPSNAFSFIDKVDDDWGQQGYAAGPYVSGPTNLTNIKIAKLNAENWDIMLKKVEDLSKTLIVLSNETPIYGINLYGEGEDVTDPESLKSLSIRSLSNNEFYQGRFRLYHVPRGSSSHLDGSNIGEIPCTNATPVSLLTLSQPLAVSTERNDETRLILTFEPEDFDSKAKVYFHFNGIDCSGFNGGVAENTNVLLRISYMNMVNNAVNLTTTSLLPSYLLQSTNQVAALKITMNGMDSNETLNLERLNFTLVGNSVVDIDVDSLLLYEDNGSSLNILDAADTFVQGSASSFYNKTAVMTFLDPQIITTTNREFLLVISLYSEATIDGQFQIALPQYLQSNDFRNLAGDVPIHILPYSSDRTEVCTIQPKIDWEKDELSKIGNTIINVDNEERTIIYFSEEAVLTEFKVHIYSLLGSRVRDIIVDSDRLYWYGERNDGTYVPTGLYLVIIDHKGKSKAVKVRVLNRGN